MKRIAIISEPTFEPWDWSNPWNPGIGGSETSHIEMAQRLHRSGYLVDSFAPIPHEGQATDPAGVTWRPCDQAAVNRWNAPLYDLFIIYRAPQLLDLLPDGVPAWLICQDVDYRYPGRTLTPERQARLTRLVGLCETHCEYLRAKYPAIAERVAESSNGIHLDRIEAASKAAPERDPHRLMYASSPDRGLEFLLKIFPKAREVVSDLSLHCFYGFDNIDKIIAMKGTGGAKMAAAKKQAVLALMDQPGVVFHGRVGQTEIIQEWFKTGIWCHPSNFTETSCITSMDAQACGAVPITSPVWAIDQNVRFGVSIQGNVSNELIQARYFNELVKLALDERRQAEIREPMIGWSRSRFGWRQVADQWAAWVDDDTAAAPAPSLEAEKQEVVSA